MDWSKFARSHYLTEDAVGGVDEGGSGGGAPESDKAAPKDAVDDIAGNSDVDDLLADFGYDLAGDKEDGKGDKGDDKGGTGDDGGEAAAGKADKGKPDADEKDTLIANLQAQLDEMSKKLSDGSAAAVSNANADAKEEPKVEPKAAESVIEEYFKDEEEYNKVLDDPKEMNKLLTKVRTDAANQAREDVMRSIPLIITPLVNTTIAVSMASAQFYKDNKDLLPKKEFVGFVTNDLIGKNPDWSLEKLMGELGKEVRTRLGLKEKAEAVDKKVVGGKPAFVPKGGGGRGAAGGGTTDLSPIEQEIDDMIPRD